MEPHGGNGKLQRSRETETQRRTPVAMCSLLFSVPPFLCVLLRDLRSVHLRFKIPSVRDTFVVVAALSSL